MTPQPRRTDDLDARLFADLDRRVKEAEKAILAVLDADPDKWWPADELRTAAGHTGLPATIAITRGANPEHSDLLELDARLRVRRRR